MIQNGELFVIHELHQEGLSISSIARRTGLSRKTVGKYLQQGLKVPRYGPRGPHAPLGHPPVIAVFINGHILVPAGQRAIISDAPQVGGDFQDFQRPIKRTKLILSAAFL